MLKRICLYFTCCCLALISSCNQHQETGRFSYGTQNKESYRLFDQGWQQIMDTGEWTQSEASYRKAVQLDPNFLIANSLVGRLTKDLKERDAIYRFLEANKSKRSPEERLLLDVYMISMQLLTYRDKEQPFPEGFIEKYYTTSENNFRTFVHTYPEEDYVKAEYIEILHAIYGPQQAIDSLHKLASPRQRNIPFYISYEAIMDAELGNFKAALSKADDLSLKLNNPSYSSQHALYADIYHKMDSLVLAKKYIDTAVHLEPKHIIAQRLKKQIDAALAKE